MSGSQHGEELPQELKSLEAALAGLTPSAGRLDRDRVMYLAGQASVKVAAPIGRFGWPMATAASLVLSITLGALLLTSGRSDRQNSEAIATIAPEAHSPAATSVADRNEYFQLRHVVLSRGVDALPKSTGAGQSTDSQQPIQLWPTRREKMIGGSY